MVLPKTKLERTELLSWRECRKPDRHILRATKPIGQPTEEDLQICRTVVKEIRTSHTIAEFNCYGQQDLLLPFANDHHRSIYDKTYPQPLRSVTQQSNEQPFEDKLTWNKLQHTYIENMEELERMVNYFHVRLGKEKHAEKPLNLTAAITHLLLENRKPPRTWKKIRHSESLRRPWKT